MMNYSKICRSLRMWLPKMTLWGMWLYTLVTGGWFFLYCYDGKNLSRLFTGIVWTLPLVSVLLGRFSSLKTHIQCFFDIVLLRDILYWMGLAIWLHGFAEDHLTQMTTFAVVLFTILALKIFFQIFHHLGKVHPLSLAFTFPFILAISIGLGHMWVYIWMYAF